MNGSSFLHRYHPLVLAMTTIMATSVYAEETVENVYTLPEIVVTAEQSSITEGSGSYTAKSTNTATKLDLSIRETPQTVKVLTREYLDDANITSFQQMLNSITGLTPNRMDERQYPVARGFDVDYYLIDGAPTTQSSMNAFDPDLSLYDRVELVKGVNGLTSGAGNPAIAINLVRKHANAKEFTGNVSTSFGSWNAWTSSADISTPLNSDGSVRGRVVVKHEQTDSFMDSYEKENNVIYGVVDADITDSTYLSFGASYQDLKRSGIRWGGLPAFYTDGSRTNFDFDRKQTVSSDWTYWNNKTKTAFAQIKQNLFNDIQLNVNYQWSEVEQETALLYLWGAVDKATQTSGIGTPFPYADQSKRTENNIDTFISAPFTLGGLKQEIVAGFMYNKSEIDSWYAGAPSLSRSYYDFNQPNIPLTTAITTPNIYQAPDATTQTGIYLAGKFQLLEPLKLVAGARLSDWEYERTDGVGNRKFNNEVTPYAGIIFDFLDNYSWYASYTGIFKPEDKKDVTDQYLDPREGKSYETGLKGEFLNGNLNTTLSVFRTQQDNVAEELDGVFILDANGNPTNRKAYHSVDGVESKGVEFELDGKITDNWNLSFGVAHFNAEAADGTKVQTNASRTTADLFTKYAMNQWSVGGGLNYKSDFYLGEGASLITQDAYILANLMAAYDVNKDVKVQLNVNNLFDKKYFEGIGSYGMVYGEPRNATLTLRYNF